MDIKFMEAAMREAKKAFKEGEIPIGAVIVKKNTIISKTHNMKEQFNCSTKHAEIIAIEKASNILETWRLNDCEIYLTMEPCLMCYGALIQCRISKIYYLLNNDKFGSITSVGQALNNIKSNHKLNIKKINNKEMEMINKKMLKDFFEAKR